MDLTTVECALLAGSRYTSPEDFVKDVALVFSNAIIFNKDGKDIGDPLSCAYYDASIHLLRYCRWLSLELLSEYVDSSDHVDEPTDPNLPLTSWKLTEGNRQRVKQEMYAIVMDEQIERSLEGDRFTWTEGECEKLLKALRHQSDLKFMSFFIQPNYPADYTAFIAKPMDWEHVQKNLRRRQYEKFREVVEDLRLIFLNALKYNERHAGTDSVSGRAFDAAKYMSNKLEVAINKMMVTVSDRLERERIDHEIAEREIAAAERAEEERIRAQWKSENPGKEGGPTPAPRVESAQRVRTLTKRAAAYRREQADFEVPFFDEDDDGQHETSYLAVVREQKAIFERQRQERIKMQQATSSLASGLFMRLAQQDLARQWVIDERRTLGIPSQGKPKEADRSMKDLDQSNQAAFPAEASQVLKTLDATDRKPFQLKIPQPKAKAGKKSKSEASLNVFGDDSD
jgi:Bromodomain